MKLSKKIIATAVLMSATSIASAADLSSANTQIEINVTKDALITLTGTLSTNTVKNITDVADLNDTDVVLGTLGTKSNTPGACEVRISTDNGFKLINEYNTNLHGTDSYSIKYEGGVFTNGASDPVTLTNCQNTASNVVLDPVAIADMSAVEAGTYSDTVYIEVAAQ